MYRDLWGASGKKKEAKSSEEIAFVPCWVLCLPISRLPKEREISTRRSPLLFPFRTAEFRLTRENERRATGLFFFPSLFSAVDRDYTWFSTDRAARAEDFRGDASGENGWIVLQLPPTPLQPPSRLGAYTWEPLTKARAVHLLFANHHK